jgi:DNA primase
MIPDEQVEQILHAADIVAIIGEHVKIKKTGSVYRGPCPFHQGTNNNFSVVPGKGYTCFVCGEKGSVFTFVQKRLGMSFVEAVKYVGEKSGIEVKEVQRTREGPDPREPVWELNGTASAWFRDLLWDNDLGASARNYLAQRGLKKETADRFGIGFAPRELGLMRSYLNGLGFDDARLMTVGLMVQREDQLEPRPRFRDRLIFPIADATGHTVGFGGRLIGPGEPKYLNSSESETFSKGKLLYNMHQARSAIRREERVVVVEGYFDVVRLVEGGIECVVAPMGTALTEEQADALQRLTKNVFLLYDADGPGQKASFRAAELLLKRGMSVRVATLPEGDDPDTFVQKHGGPAMEKLLSAAMDVFDRKVQLLERSGWFADLQRKRRALDALLPTIRGTTDPLTRDLYVARLSEAAGVERSVLVQEMNAASAADARRARVSTPMATPREIARATTVPAPRPVGPYRGNTPESAAERSLVRLVLAAPEAADSVHERLSRMEEEGGHHPDIDEVSGPGNGALRDPVYRAIFDAVLMQDGVLDLEGLAESLEPQAIAVVEELMAEAGEVGDQAVAVDAAISVLSARLLSDRIADIERMTPLASDEEKGALNMQKRTLIAELVRVDPRAGWKLGRRGPT